MPPEMPPSEGPMIRVQGLSKTYQTLTAVDNLSFDVYPGQILGLIGRNGAGKTTTLRSLSGIIPASNGSISLCGHDVAAEPIAAKRCLAMIPDDPSLFDLLTVWEHLEFIGATYGLDHFESRAEELLELFELSEKRDAVAQELSRGMRQKVSVCCALLHEPGVLFFDEPLTGLDPRAIRTLKDCIQKQALEQRAVIISSHLLSLVEDMCTDLLILERGVSRYCGPLDQLRESFPEAGQEASLESVFFFATEQDGAGQTSAVATTTSPAIDSNTASDESGDQP